MKNMNQVERMIVGGAAALVFLSGTAFGAVIFQQTFDVNTANAQATYPQYTYTFPNVDVTAEVVNQQLNLIRPANAGSAGNMVLNPTVFPTLSEGLYRISTDAGGSGGLAGDWGVGLKLTSGAHFESIVFLPGYTGANGFQIRGDTSTSQGHGRHSNESRCDGANEMQNRAQDCPGCDSPI